MEKKKISIAEAEELLANIKNLNSKKPSKIKYKKQSKNILTQDQLGDEIHSRIFDLYYRDQTLVTPGDLDFDGVLSVDLRKHRPVKDSIEESKLIEQTFNYYRCSGFPYPTCNDGRLYSLLRRLRNTKSCIENNYIRSNHTGSSEATSFHPEIFNVQCRDRLTPMEVFNDDSRLKRCIKTRIRRGDNIKPYGIRQRIVTAPGSQAASNFRPAAAKSIISRYNAKVVLDPCMGWGGRMLGALGANVNYIGIDPSTNVIKGNKKLLHSLRRIYRSTLSPVTLIWGCAEDILGNGLFSPDLVFTSPPYFDTEHYSSELTQSYIRYPTYEMWCEKFLGQLIYGAYKDLVIGGHLVLNVDYDMLPELYEHAYKYPLKLVETLTLLMGSRPKPGRHQKNREEPVVVFQKVQ